MPLNEIPALTQSLAEIQADLNKIEAMPDDLVGIPSGGTTGQVLKKASDINYQIEWANESGGLPSGGDANDILVKNSSSDYDTYWDSSLYGQILSAWGMADDATWMLQTLTDISGFNFPPSFIDNICFQIYPAAQKFLTAALTNIGSSVVITYDATDDPDFTFELQYIKFPWLAVPQVDKATFEESPTACLYLTRKCYITNYYAEYLDCSYPFTYNGTGFLIDLQRVRIAYENGTGQPPTITIEGSATM